MGDAYKREIDKLKGEVFGLAFVPLDPRLENEYLGGRLLHDPAGAGLIPHAFQIRLSSRPPGKDPAAEGFRDRIVAFRRAVFGFKGAIRLCRFPWRA
jgi:hypothetical protein